MYETRCKNNLILYFKEVYFVSRKTGSNPKGKFFNKKRNTGTLLRQLGVKNISKRHIKKLEVQQTDIIPASTEMLELKEWLKLNKAPWEKILSYWDKTLVLRTHSLSIEETFKDWPILKNARAIDLVIFIQFFFVNEILIFD